VGLALATPVLAALVVALSLDELHRTVAAGAHAAVLEQRIARKVGEDEAPLIWESEVQRRFKPKEDKIRHRAILAVLFAATAPAVVLGISDFGEDHTPEWALVVIGVALICAAACWYQRSTLNALAALHDTARRKMQKIRGAAG
jgi:hypothetical protein